MPRLFPWFLLAVLLLTRFLPLLGDNIWFDELYSIKMASHSYRDMPFFLDQDVHPPLYYFWLRLFLLAEDSAGNTAGLAWLRLASVIPGLLLIPLLGTWGRLCGGRTTGWLVAAIAIVTPGLCFYSQELRSYTLAMIFVTLAGMAAVSLVQRPAPLPALLYVVSSAAQVYTHYLCIMIVAASGLWLLWHLPLVWRGQPRRAAVWLPIALATTLFVLSVMMYFVFSVRWGIYQGHTVFLPKPPWIEIFTTFVYDFPAGTLLTQSWWTPYGVLCSYIVVLGGLWLFVQLRRNPARLRRNPTMRFSLSYCLMVIELFVLVTWSATMLDFGRFFSGHRLAMLVLPLWILLVGLCVDGIPRSKVRRAAALFLILFCFPCCLLSLWQRYRYSDTIDPLLGGDPELTMALREKSLVPILLDEQLDPWIASRPGGHRIGFLDDFFNLEPEIYRSYALYDIRGFRLLAGTDRENFVLAFVEAWWREKNPIIRMDHGAVARYTIRGNDLRTLQRDLKAALAAVAHPPVRDPDKTILPAHAAEFVTAFGLSRLEYHGNDPFRWTEGERQEWHWDAPDEPGIYRLSMHFYRPTNRANENLTARFSINRGKEIDQTLGSGSIVLEQDINVTQPNQRMAFSLKMPGVKPYPDSADTRSLGMMFLRMRMERQP